MDNNPPHPSVSSIREIVARAVNAGQVPARYIADHLRAIADDISPRDQAQQQQEPPPEPRS